MDGGHRRDRQKEEKEMKGVENERLIRRSIKRMQEVLTR